LSVESSPLFRTTMRWKIYDAATGLIDEGTTDLSAMHDETPWPSGKHALALTRGRAAAAS
jgi:hypothetical protein